MMTNLRLWGPEPDHLDRIATSPVVQQKLRAALTPDEIAFLASTQIVIQKNDVSDEWVDALCRQVRLATRGFIPAAEIIEVIRDWFSREPELEERELDDESEADDQRELVRLKALGLRRKEEQLYRCLEKENEGLLEEHVIEILYKTDYYQNLTPSKLKTYKNRLKTLCCTLNRKLECATSPNRVRRDSSYQDQFTKGGELKKVIVSRLMLKGCEEDDSPDEEEDNDEMDELTKEAFNSLSPAEQREVLAEEETAVKKKRASKTSSKPKVKPTVAKCMAAIREYLKDGERESASLDKHCQSAKFTPSTIRKARESLGIKPRKTGGTGSKWVVSLPEN